MKKISMLMFVVVIAIAVLIGCSAGASGHFGAQSPKDAQEISGPEKTFDLQESNEPQIESELQENSETTQDSQTSEQQNENIENTEVPLEEQNP